MKSINQAGEKWQIKRDGLGFSTTRFEVKHDKGGIRTLPFILGSLMHTSAVSREDAELFADKIVRAVNLLEVLEEISAASETYLECGKCDEYHEDESCLGCSAKEDLQSTLSKLSELKKSLSLP